MCSPEQGSGLIIQSFHSKRGSANVTMSDCLGGPKPLRVDTLATCGTCNIQGDVKQSINAARCWVGRPAFYQQVVERKRLGVDGWNVVEQISEPDDFISTIPDAQGHAGEVSLSLEVSTDIAKTVL